MHSDVLEKCKVGTRLFPAGSHVFHDGDSLENVFVVKDGWAMIYRLISNGKRQIIDFVLRGDLLGYPVHADNRTGSNALSLNDLHVCVLRRELFTDLSAGHPEAAEFLVNLSARSAMRAQDLLVNIGARSAASRVAYLLEDVVIRACERLSIQWHHPIDFAVTQQDIADALGLSSVYVNRILKEMDKAGIAKLRHGTLLVRDFERLRYIAAFGHWNAETKGRLGDLTCESVVELPDEAELTAG